MTFKCIFIPLEAPAAIGQWATVPNQQVIGTEVKMEMILGRDANFSNGQVQSRACYFSPVLSSLDVPR